MAANEAGAAVTSVRPFTALPPVVRIARQMACATSRCSDSTPGVAYGSTSISTFTCTSARSPSAPPSKPVTAMTAVPCDLARLASSTRLLDTNPSREPPCTEKSTTAFVPTGYSPCSHGSARCANASAGSSSFVHAVRQLTSFVRDTVRKWGHPVRRVNFVRSAAKCAAVELEPPLPATRTTPLRTRTWCKTSAALRMSYR